jgi:hypothetical protein
MTKPKSPEKEKKAAVDASVDTSSLYPVDVVLHSFKTTAGKVTTTIHVPSLTCNLNFQCLFLPIPAKNLDLRYDQIESFHHEGKNLSVEMNKEFRDLEGIYSVQFEGESEELDKIKRVLEFKKVQLV